MAYTWDKNNSGQAAERASHSGSVAVPCVLTTRLGVKVPDAYIIKGGNIIPDGMYVKLETAASVIDELVYRPHLNRKALLAALEAIGAKEAVNLINTGLFDLPANLEDK